MSLLRTHGLPIAFLFPLAAFASLLAVQRFDYFRNATLNPYPDAKDYLLLGKNLREQGVFSRDENLEPDLLRTPGYPVLIGLLCADQFPARIYAVQSVGHIVVLILMWRIARHFLSSQNRLSLRLCNVGVLFLSALPTLT